MLRGRRFSRAPLACVLADLDLVRPLARAGIRCVVAASKSDPVRWSRHTHGFLDRSTWRTPEEHLERLLEFGAGWPEPPVLFVSNDQDLLLVSRNRNALAESFRLPIADADLIETLLFKTRARARFTELGFPVPDAWPLRPAEQAPPAGIEFPVVVKPVVREHHQEVDAKARRVESADVLRALWHELAKSGDEHFAERLIPGAEDRIESYHAYVDARGFTRGEFTGRKLRTLPFEYGNTTALVITDEPDVLGLGREILGALGLRGAAKVDFKRDPEGRLWLLEVNPRFNLWHHAGAHAGVNLPALAFADMTGGEPPAVGRARAGVRWSDPMRDRKVRREAGLSRLEWLRWTLACETRWSIAWDDPAPFADAILVPYVLRRARRLVQRGPRNRASPRPAA